ncbi:MAG: hypothetical protein QM817_05505 [Archangium sp.]
MKNHILLLALCALACGQPGVHVKDRTCGGCLDANGLCLLGNTLEACGAAGAVCMACAGDQVCSAGACVGGDGGIGFAPDANVSSDGGYDDCSAEAKLIYVLDQDRTLLSFDPLKLATSGGAFQTVGRISCPSEPGAEPFSMAVDRSATAWIIYDSGELFTVNLRAYPLDCVKTVFVPQYGVAKFGMGFVANQPGSHEETLYISGSELTGSLATTRFGTLSTTPPHQLMLRGILNGAPEITGTGDAKLWAFFPNVTPPKVAQLDKTDGGVLNAFEAQALTGRPRAWAFAFWGGDFFLFLERDTDLSTQLWRMDGVSGNVTKVMSLDSRHIVGAGVSTCAPVEIN